MRTADAVMQVTSAMLYAEIFPQMARRGAELRDFSILTFGGAGPTHVFMAARDLPVARVIIPPTPGTTTCTAPTAGTRPFSTMAMSITFTMAICTTWAAAVSKFKLGALGSGLGRDGEAAGLAEWSGLGPEVKVWPEPAV